MRHTRPVHRLTFLKSAIILATLCLSLAAQTHESGGLVLDLTKPVPREEELNVLPGASVGGVAGRQLSPGFTLPVVLDLQSISPQLVEAGAEFIVVVRLRNTGRSAFKLPSSQKNAEVLKQGNKGRQSFVFSLVFSHPESHHKSSVIMAGCVGSDAVPSSFLTIAPGQSVRVFFKGDLSSLGSWLRGDLRNILVRAQVVEWKFEDKRFFLESESEPVLSESILRLDLAKPN